MKEKVDLLIFIGQSNMQGSTGEPCTFGKVENALEYRYLSDSFVELENPVGEDIGDKLLLKSAKGNGSLIPPFCKAYMENSLKKVVAIHTAKGDSSIIEWQKGTERFDAMMEKIKKGKAKTLVSFDIDKIFAVWLQGESDALKVTPAEDYLKMLTNIKNELKAEIGIDRFGIIRVGRFAEFAGWIKLPVKEKRKADTAIRKVQDKAARVDSDFAILTRITKKLSVTKKYLNPKEYGPHYNNDGMKIIGSLAGKKLAKIRNK